MKSNDTEDMTFWQHLDQLRSVLFRILIATLVPGVAAFVFRQQVFDLVLAPRSDDFVTYRILNRIAAVTGISGVDHFEVQLINTALADQFMIHIKVAFCVGAILASPYIIYLLFRFIAPALYTNERKYALRVTLWGYGMFMLGMAVSYFLVFPLTFRFLGLYQVDADVPNLITLQSYISTMMVMTLTMGIVFEIPAIMWLLGRVGVLNRGYLTRYRRHAIVVIVAIAAIITPTGDVLTLLVVSLPMWLLFETGILLLPKHIKTTN